MKTSRYLAVIAVAVLAATASSNSESGAAMKTACQVLPASQVSRIVGKALTSRLMVVPANPAGVCAYYTPGAGEGSPILQSGYTTFETADLAARNFHVLYPKSSQIGQDSAARQKGKFIVTVMTMNGDRSKLSVLADAAAKNL